MTNNKNKQNKIIYFQPCSKKQKKTKKNKKKKQIKIFIKKQHIRDLLKYKMHKHFMLS